MKKGTNAGGMIYSAYITLKNGKRIYASQYGIKAFCFPAKETKKK